MTPVFLVVGGLGFAMVYSAVTGQPLMEALRETFTRPASEHKRPAGVPILGTDSDGEPVDKAGNMGSVFDRARESAGLPAPTTPAPALSNNPCRALPVPSSLVKIGQSMHSLEAAAAASHARASSAAGGFISVTDSFRTYAQQAQCHAEKPTTCATPGGSCHEKGLAIDVVDMRNQRVIDALTAEGWVRFAPEREPWHWSYRVRG